MKILKITRMKFALTSLFAFILLIVASCKKENDSDLGKMNGDYNVYRLIIEDPNDGPLEYPVPAPNGDYSKAVVKANNDSTMSVKIYYFNNKKDTLDRVSLTGRVTKASNGDLRFVNGNNWLGTFGKNAEVELYPNATSTLYAKK
jgi:hypothetical protein